MASPALLQSNASSFHGQFPLASSPFSVRLPYGNPRNGCGFSVKASSEIVLVEKSEAVKTNRLKTTYLEKIVPLLKEEFSYQNMHEVTPFLCLNLSAILMFCLIGGKMKEIEGSS